MNSDSATPNVNPNSAFSDVEADENPVLPDAEVNSVLLYLRTNAIAIRDPQKITVENPEITNQKYSISEDTEETQTAATLEQNETTSTDIVDINPTIPAADGEQSQPTSPENVDKNETITTEDNQETNPLLDLASPEVPLTKPNPNLQVNLKREDDKLLLILPPESQVPTSEASLSEIWQQLKLRLNAGDRLQSANTPVHLVAGNRLLDVRHLQELGETLGEHQMQLKSVSTSRRQTAIAAATAGYSVEQVQIDSLLGTPKSTSNTTADALYLEMTVRSGIEIRHPGSVIILGDVNPGGNVVADGDILVWGRLRGIAHAGAGGNRQCLIMALQMEPTQLRIADAVARAPEKSPTQFYPEVAYIAPEGIRIAKTNEFSRPQFSNLNVADTE